MEPSSPTPTVIAARDPAPGATMAGAPFREAARMTFLYRACWLAARTLARLFFRWRAYHVERIPAEGPVILASNHESFADPPLVGCAVPRAIYFLARDSLFEWPGFGGLIRRLNAVPVDRDGAGAAGLKAILDRLRSGGGILLFPEGTRSRDGRLQAARSGIGLTVIKSEAPVVPVRIFGAFAAWGPHRRIPLPREIVVKFGEPLDFTVLRAEAREAKKARLKEIYQEIADEIMRAIAKLEPTRDVRSFPE